VTDEMFMAAAHTLAHLVSEADIKQAAFIRRWRGSVKSVHIAAVVADIAYKRGLATGQAPKDFIAYIRSQMYDPSY
jgi:malate dehydrogenase (oxaloacetate-decarboxylating)(NADP+)